MKYIIIGMHSSGKHEVADILRNNGIKCGKLFTNLDINDLHDIYGKSNYEYYSTKDVNDIFENNAYVFMHEFPFTHDMLTVDNYYEGLSLYEFENNDVFVMSPDQLFAISQSALKGDITFIWMDNPKKERLNRYHSDRCSYNFYDRESIELRDASSFVKFLYSFDNSNVMYFTSEEPTRVAAILYAVIKHPDLLPIYTDAFN